MPKRSLVLKRKHIKDSKNLEKSLYVRDKAKNEYWTSVISGPSGGTALKQVMEMEIPAWVQESVSVTMAHRAIHTSRLKLYRVKMKPHVKMMQTSNYHLWAKAHLK